MPTFGLLPPLAATEVHSPRRLERTCWGCAGGAVAAATVYGDPGPVMRDDGTWYTKIPSPPLWANVLAHIAVALIALGTALLLAAVGHAMYAWIRARKKVNT